jgi:hypothetical protein
LGRGNLTGDYKKISLAQNDDVFFTFIELNHYAFPINNQRDSGNISLGFPYSASKVQLFFFLI